MAITGSPAYRFGEFTLDVEAHRLTRRGRAIPLQPKLFDTLRCLVERPGRLVTKRELHTRVWGDVAVSDGAMVRCIAGLRKALGDTAMEPRYLETVPRLGYRFIGQVEVVSAPDPAPVAPAATRTGRALVVLPFVDLNHDPGQEYFADGFTDLLISDLGRIAALHVISRTSAMCYRETTKTLPEIARELRVDTAVEGSILCVGTRVRITVQLIEAPTDRHLWARSYERELHDVLRLQREVARDITSAVHLALTADESQRLGAARVVDPEAHEAYLKGCYFWHKRTPADVARSTAFFQRAIEQDSMYAPPHAGLARASGVAGFFGYLPPAQAFAQMKAHATAALKLDASLADAHACLAAVHLFYEWDWTAAEDRFLTALDENPNHAVACEWHGWCLFAQGRLGEALAEMRRARDMDPLSARAHAQMAMSLYFARQHERAIDCLKAAVELDPRFADAHCGLGLNYQQLGLWDRAFAELEESLALSGRSVEDIASLGFAYGAAGRTGDAHALLAELDGLRAQRYVPPVYFAAIHAGLGNTEAALDWLDRALADRSSWLVFLRVEPWWDGLRTNARFEQLLQRMRL
jgi:TolB-like protein/tetratricopeptide (TPR) repeat protein